MSLFKKVAIIGTGLIGGSIGLILKKKHLACEVVGVSRHKKSLALAKERGAIDKGSQALSVIKGADLLILATPVSVILNLAPQISRLIGKDCLVTDVASTKQEIASSLGKIFKHYVGSHPLAGSEKRSIAYADSGMFKNSLCILTPVKHTDKKALRKIRLLWAKMGAKTVLLNPQTHDKILSFISHLPHVAAFSLISMMPKNYLRFSAGGLKDTTRIAASDSALWADILLTNRKNIAKNIGQLQGNLGRIKSLIQKKDRNKLVQILEKAKAKRESLG